MDLRYGRVEWGAPGKGVGTRARTSEGYWRQPLRWNKAAETAGTRPFVFCASLADVFDNAVPNDWRVDLFELIRATPRLVWLLLSKRPQNMQKLCMEAGGLPANAALGTTAEDQARANINVPALLDAAAALDPNFTFLSCEPLLGGINPQLLNDKVALNWIITGGETDQGGHKARPSHPDWFRRLRDTCLLWSGGTIAYHHKQNGEWTESYEPGADGPTNWIWPGGTTREIVNAEHWPEGAIPIAKVGKKAAGRLLDGVLHDARPEVR